MSDPDLATIAALGAEVVRPAFLGWLDFAGDPIRATTWETSLAITGSGDSDLDGHEFSAVDPRFINVGPVKRQTGGSDTVTVSLSGIVGPDSELLDVLGDETRWKGRFCRLWFVLKHEDGTNVGGFVPYFKGRMVDYSIDCKPTTQTVNLLVETYLAMLTDASNRTYLDQADFDPNDQSAGLTLAVANGAKTAAALATQGAGGGGFGSSQDLMASY